MITIALSDQEAVAVYWSACVGNDSDAASHGEILAQFGTTTVAADSGLAKFREELVSRGLIEEEATR